MKELGIKTFHVIDELQILSSFLYHEESIFRELNLGEKMDKPFAAHTKEASVQTIKEHLLGTAEKCKEFGQTFRSGENAYLCGIFHDIGKYSDKFQKRIYEEGNPVDHSTAGAVEIYKCLPRTGILLSYCISGHHTGLPDGGSRFDTADEATLYGRLKKELEPYSVYKSDLEFEFSNIKPTLPIRPIGKGGFSVSFYIRMLFSCLADSDFLDTENYMQGDKERGGFESIDELNQKFDKFIYHMKAPESSINKVRADILSQCIEKACGEKGLYTLTIPTGGGKTISSLAFALKHAREYKQQRIIYVIPYNSIIEQNAAVFKDILGAENVLEHHSNYSYDNVQENEQADKYNLASENWDVPVIVTTTVQFFESLFSNKASKCRKLHNIANSIIIFDEAQLFPLPYLKPCIHAISELVYNYGSSVVLCSATQPKLTDLFPKEISVKEIYNETEKVFLCFKRTKIIFTGELQDTDLAQRLNEEKQVLCIVNTRKHAQNVFDLLNGDGCYHLSTLMYPKHRKEILKEIRERLKESLPCRVISTSLIEAGVDVDFPVVYRAEAGLDSVIQAAGRCNREATKKEGTVYVFKPAKEYRKQMPDMLKRPAEITNIIAHQFSDISSPEAISSFFSELYKVGVNHLDVKKIVNRFETGMERDFSFPFAEIAAEFHLIETATRPIIITRTDEADKLVQRLKIGEKNRNLMREIQQYSVNVYEYNYNSLYRSGSIQALDEELAVLIDESKYSDKTGLDISDDIGIGIFV